VELSARNQLTGTITDVKLGGIMAEVTMDIGATEVLIAKP
jgi:molybdopterin-binding protein